MEKTIDANYVTAIVAAETPPPSSLITLDNTLPCLEGHGVARWVHRTEARFNQRKTVSNSASAPQSTSHHAFNFELIAGTVK
jgi:hypothetical protein